MTDARLPGRWLFDPALDKLSDRAFRVFSNALMYSAEQGTDGHLLASSLRFLHPLGVTPAEVDELVAARLWRRLAGGDFQVCDWEKTQSTASEMAQKRANAAARAKKYREGKKTASNQNSSRVTSPVAPKARQGKARTGQDREELPAQESNEPEYVTAWRQSKNPPVKGQVA